MIRYEVSRCQMFQACTHCDGHWSRLHIFAGQQAAADGAGPPSICRLRHCLPVAVYQALQQVNLIVSPLACKQQNQGLGLLRVAFILVYSVACPA
jgi:hypothetical protein